MKYHARAKELMLSTPEDEDIPFPLKLSSAHVLIADNQLILKYPKDLRAQVI